jgi:hypothetical protein
MIQESLKKGDLVLVPADATSVQKGGMAYVFVETIKKPFLAIFEKSIDEDHCEVITPDGTSKIVFYSEIYKPKGTEYGSEIKQKRKTSRTTAKEQNNSDSNN